MVQYDPKLVDQYVVHLAELSKQQTCIAKEDIYNEFGVLLIKKGATISPSHADKLNQHRLTKGVDEVLALENRLTDGDLLDAVLAFLELHPCFFAIHDKNNFEQALFFLCKAQARNDVLLQKLTVLKAQFAEDFEETLFIAWFSALLAYKQNVPKDEIIAVFTAGLYSNLGLLHIPEAAVQNPKENREAYQTHPIISSLIAKATKRHTNATLLAIMEHHEKPYGDGYPHSKNLERISPLGLLTVTSSTLIELMHILPKEQGKNPGIALPYLRINNSLTPNPAFTTALKCIVVAQLPPIWEGLSINPQEYNDFLLDKALAICQLSACINLLRKLTIVEIGAESVSQLRAQLQRAVALLNSTGFSNLDIIDMLSGTQEDELLSVSEMVEFDLIESDFVNAVRMIRKCLLELIESDALEQSDADQCKEQDAFIASILEELPADTYFHLLKANDNDEAEQQNKQDTKASKAPNKTETVKDSTNEA